ncbi:MAG: M48 family metallopeptidase [Kiritimatiellaeota bacterium]|nr:M48 family metallopeptidase [Kiritimatiellota bacterium]
MLSNLRQGWAATRIPGAAGRRCTAAHGLAGLLLLAALAGLTSCTTPDPVTGRGYYNLYTLADDAKLGRAAMDQNMREMRTAGVRINTDAARVAQLQEMVRRLGAVTHYPQLPYSVTLFQTNIVNAAALPGGPMMVFAGLYNPTNGLVRDEDEMAAVMGHELAHVNCRHSTRRLSVIMSASLLAEVGVALLEQKDQQGWAQALQTVFMAGTALWIPTYSRKDEFQADAVGLLYMARAGYDPRAAPRIWQRAATQDRKQAARVSIFASHPADKARYEALQKQLPAALEIYERVRGGQPPDGVPGDRAPAPRKTVM